MQLRYVFSELGQGLRRNLSMHVAVVLTLFVSLTLVGLGLLLQQQSEKTQGYWGSQLQITAFFCKDNDSNVRCTGEVTAAQKAAVLKVIDKDPNVADFHVESKEQAFEKVKELLGPEKFEGPNPPATAEAMRESVWVTMKDPRDFVGLESAVIGLDGVSGIRDASDVLGPIFDTIWKFKVGAWAFAAFLVVAALLLVANTIRLAAFARRKEIGIMRLVGASSLYIALPFLLEALVTAFIGVVLGGVALAAFWKFVIHDRLAKDLQFTPWIGFDACLWAVAIVAVIGPILTLLPTLLLTRKYLKV
jgi:cell division transport system permease protein